MICIGAHNRANSMGLRRFLKRGWPQVRALYPDAQLRVAGAVCQSLAQPVQGVAPLGIIADLTAEYRQARLVINCVEAASGISIKTVDALCEGKCLITYPAGAQGLAEAADILLQVGSPLAMAGKINALLTQPATVERIALNAYHFSRDFFAPSRCMARLIEIIYHWASPSHSSDWRQTTRRAWLATLDEQTPRSQPPLTS